MWLSHLHLPPESGHGTMLLAARVQSEAREALVGTVLAPMPHHTAVAKHRGEVGRLDHLFPGQSTRPQEVK